MPQMQQIHIELNPPSLKDNTAVIDRLAKGLRSRIGEWPRVALRDLERFAKVLRESNYQVTAMLSHVPGGPVVVELRPGDTSGGPADSDLAQRAKALPAGLWGDQGLGLALDIGSTHLAGALIDQSSGEELCRDNQLNPQTRIGSDILTRIQAAINLEVKSKLHEGLIQAANTLLARLCNRAGKKPQEVRGICAAGNTTMTHFFLDLDTQSICREPYIPLINRPAPFYASELGLIAAKDAVAWCLPNVGSYFGGDLVAGIVAAELHRREDVAIMVDVGTNAEVVVGNRDWLLACAGAAGPALEGGVARMGVLAGPGAIEAVRIDPVSLKPEIGVIPAVGGEVPPPKGLCGSGLLQLMAQMYLCRIMDMRGKIIPREHERIIRTDEGLGYVVVPADQAADGRAISVSEVEIDILLRSKAAMYTILRTLLMQVGLEFSDLAEFFVAGAFGNVIDPDTAITLGMLPDLPRERFAPLGNSSLKGCIKLIREPDTRAQVEAVAGRLTYLELNVNQELMNRFSAARFIPHTDHTRFPSVPVFHSVRSAGA